MLVRRSKKQNPAKPFDVVDQLFGGWDYPEPIQLLGADYHPGQDPHLKKLIYMAEHGWYYCQKAIIEMSVIHPWTDYQPPISDEFRETFNKQHNLDPHESDPFELLIYERDGKLIMSNDWETYWMYRGRKENNAYCVLIGHFSDEVSIVVTDKPFVITKPNELNFSN